MSKKWQYILGFFALGTVVLAFLALLLVSTTIALTAAFLAIISTIMSLGMLFFQQEEIDEDRREIASKRGSRSE